MAKRPHWYAAHPPVVHVATASNAAWRGRPNLGVVIGPRIPFRFLPVMSGSIRR